MGEGGSSVELQFDDGLSPIINSMRDSDDSEGRTLVAETTFDVVSDPRDLEEDLRPLGQLEVVDVRIAVCLDHVLLLLCKRTVEVFEGDLQIASHVVAEDDVEILDLVENGGINVLLSAHR